MEKLTGASGYILKRANTLYKSGDYDGALMFYNKGINLKPHSQDFQKGKLKTETAIEQRKNKQQKTKATKKDDPPKEKENAEKEIQKTETTNAPTDQHDIAPLLKQKMKEYGHLSSKEVFLLQKGIVLYKNKEYDLSLKYFQEGKKLNPLSEEFQFYTHMAAKNLAKEVEEKKKLKEGMPPPIKREHIEKIPEPEECSSRSTTVRELHDEFSYRHRYLLEKAEKCYNQGDFHGSFGFCEKGLELQPKSKVFQRSKDKAYDGILISLGLKSPTGDMGQRFVVVELAKAQQFMNDKEYEQAIEQCKQTLTSIKEMPLQKINDKDSLIATAFSILGNCYIYTGNNEKALFYHKEDLNMGKVLDNDDIRSRALTNAGRVFVKMKEYDKALEMWLANLDIGVDDADERSWLTHEIAQCYMELKEYENTIKYAEICLSAATIAEKVDTKTSALTLIGQSAIRTGQPKTAKDALEKALEYAKESGDFEARKTIQPVLTEIRNFLHKENGEPLDEDDEDEEDGWGQ